MSDEARCAICGEPMPPGEEMFKFHYYSGDCPKPPLPRPKKRTYEELEAALTAAESRASRAEEDAERMKAALQPFANYAEKRLAKPINGLGNSVHGIHMGTEWEAEITFTNCIDARAAIDAARGKASHE